MLGFCPVGGLGEYVVERLVSLALPPDGELDAAALAAFVPVPCADPVGFASFLEFEF